MIRTEKTINAFIGGIDRDMSVNKIDESKYFDAENMELLSNDSLSTGAMNNKKGNILRINFANGDQILDVCPIAKEDKDSVVFFAYNEATPTSRIYFLEGNPKDIGEVIEMDQEFQDFGTYKAGYIYRSDDLNFSLNHPIKSEGLFESEKIRKIYWVDGLNPMRYMILDRVDPLAAVSTFDINPVADFQEPEVELTSGGRYKSGLVQYAYQYYYRNGARTTYSPLSKTLYLTNSGATTISTMFTGTPLNEGTGKAVTVTINDLDPNYDRIRIVALHYAEEEVSPHVNIVAELKYSGTTLSFTDNGYTVLGTIPIEEFRLLGQMDFIPATLSPKDNMLFLGNIKDKKWNPDWLNPEDPSYWDARAVRWKEWQEGTWENGEWIINEKSVEENTYTHHPEDSTFFYQPESPENSTITVMIPNLHLLLGYGVPEDINPGDISNFQMIGPDSPDIMLTITYEYMNEAHDPEDPESEPWNEDTVSYEASEIDLTGWSYSVINGTLTISFENNTENEGIFNYAPTSLVSASLTSEIKFDLEEYDVGTFNPTYEGPGALLKDPINGDVTLLGLANWSDLPYNHAAVNEFNDLDNDGDYTKKFKYKLDHETLGAEGPNVEIDFEVEDMVICEYQKSSYGGYGDTISYLAAPAENNVLGTWKRSSLREEVYRMFIVFYNKKMQKSDPQWICDLRVPSQSEILLTEADNAAGELYGKYIYPKVKIKNLPADDNIIGWQVYRCKRNQEDKSILAKGIASPVGSSIIDGAFLYQPNFQFTDTATSATSGYNRFILELFSPEIQFNKNITSKLDSDRFKVEGRYSAPTNVITDPDLINQEPFFTTYMKSRFDATLPKTSTDTNNGEILRTLFEPSQPSSIIPFRKFVGGDRYRNRLRISSGRRGQPGPTLLVETFPYTYFSLVDDEYIMFSYSRNVDSVRYGGNSYEARSYNSAIPYGQFQPIEQDESICYLGDTFICMFMGFKCGAQTDRLPDSSRRGAQHLFWIPVETSINCYYRLDPLAHYQGVYPNFKITDRVVEGLSAYPDHYPDNLGDLYSQNRVYNMPLDTANLAQKEVFDNINIFHNPNKVFATDKKVHNEYFDSWTNVSLNNQIDLEGKHGHIRDMWTFNDMLFAGQDKAIAVLAVNDRSLIQDGNRAQLTLGTGEVLERFDYIVSDSGIQKLKDVVLGRRSFFYVDRNNKTLYNFTTEGNIPISDLYGIRSLMHSFNTIEDVKLGYDPFKLSAAFYMREGDREINMTYSDALECFVTRESYNPSLMFNLNNQFYSIRDNTCWLHNHGDYGSYYGVVHPSTITFIINPNAEIVNAYDYLDMRIDVIDHDGVHEVTEMFNRLLAENDYHRFEKELIHDVTAKKIAKMWRTWIMPGNNALEFYRMVDTYIKIQLVRDNTNNKKVLLHDVMTGYRPAKN